MAFSATLAHLRGLLTADDHLRLLRLFSRAGLAMDHDQLDGPLLQRATAAILRTRDGKLRAAVPVTPLGRCVFLNDVSHDDLCAALEVHKALMRRFPRDGKGIDAFVDAGDTGYTVHGDPVEEALRRDRGAQPPVNGHNGHNGHIGGMPVDGLVDGLGDGLDKPGHAASNVAVAVVDGN